MNFFIYYILPFVIVLGILIFFHELGHFLIAKYFDVKVLKFSLGFGPKLVGKKFGETEYSIRYFPLGGFVKMLGEDAEDEASQDLTPEEAKRAFNNQHVLKRMAIVAAGPFFNLVLAFLLFCGIYLVSGVHVITPEIGQVTPESPAYKAGFQKGDLVLSIEGRAIESWVDMKDIIQPSANKPLEITILRGGKVLTFTVVPEPSVIKNIFGQEVKSALIGIVSAGKIKRMEFGPLQSIKKALMETCRWIELTCLVVVKMFQGVVPFKSVGGPILIGQMTGKLAQESLSNLFPFMAIISVNLGILNLLPIPILDGGLIIFLLMELLLGKPLSLKKRELAMKVGFSLLILLMVIVTFNDLNRIRIFEKIFQLFERIFA